jgi:hypothetical protein
MFCPSLRGDARGYCVVPWLPVAPVVSLRRFRPVSPSALGLEREHFSKTRGSRPVILVATLGLAAELTGEVASTHLKA